MAEAKAGVAVIGGGIAGIQAALDLAEAGYHVYLIERDISIGGNMARLDKTFPTNDCSTCMLSPKLLEVGAHPNVEILTRCEVVRLEGEPGNFILTVKKHPRFVFADRCTACGECSKVCPIELPAEFNLGLNGRKAIYRHYPQAVPSAFAIDKAGIAPCRAACPAGISVQGYVALIAQKRYNEALRLIKRDNPFAAVCGRVCHHPCEKACYRGEIDEPIAIEALKRFVADLDLFSDHPYIPRRKGEREERVAVIGGGPAGLTAAYYLALEGYQVSIFEAMDQPGGLMIYGIPAFRLPRNVVQKEVELIVKLGIELKMGKIWGKDFSLRSLLKEESYRAVIIATGAQKPLNLNVPGEDLEGVIPAISFLRLFHRFEGKIDFDLGRRVVVIGGGNVAFDVARVARRLGAPEVTVLYRRSESELPATPEEVANAIEEGVLIQYLTGCIGIEGENGRVTGVRCIRMALGPPDESGRRRPVPVEGEFFTVPADTVFVAIGQRTDTGPFELEPPEYRPALSRWGTVVVDPITYETSVTGVFAAGDVVFGPSSVVQAVGSGKEAAVSVDRFIRGVDLKSGRKRTLSVAEKPSSIKVRKIPPSKRLSLPRLPAEKRIKGFDEVSLSPSESEALKEAGRCLNCGVCSECHRCEEVCAAGAINPDMGVEEIRLKVGGIVVATGYKTFEASKKPEYGYGRYANVITSLEYERLLSASGPTGGRIVRPGDGRVPKRIAWIQCVGSRDRTVGREYCSALCCMYAIKQALITKDHDPEVETTIFFIDMRTAGKGFERYYERARRQGIRFIRSAVSRVVETPDDQCLEISYAVEEPETSTSFTKTERFDLVVLSVGVEPNSDLSRVLGLPLDAYGFVITDPLCPSKVPARPGIAVCGVLEAPKDIPESVMQASSAVGNLMELLSAPVAHLDTEKEEPSASIPLEPPRIGVFVCHCGTNIAGVVDVKALSGYASNLPGVVYATDLLFACAGDGTKHIVEAIVQKGLNRIVVASCSPRTHEPLFQKALTSAGLNPYLLEMANIRDQCSWVHSDCPEGATRKAMDLVRMAVAKAWYLEPVKEKAVPIVQRVLVVGGGPSGMTSALTVADAGFEVALVEEKPYLGGEAVNRFFFHPSGTPIRDVLKGLVERVVTHGRITLFLSTRVLASEGHPGHFVTTLGKLDDSGNICERITVEHGAVILATGAREYKGSEYLRGTHPGVITQAEFQRMLAEESEKLLGKIKHVVMIQCVGSRDEAHPYCSRVCCTTAVSNALKFMEICPDARVSILYRDIRTFGMRELIYLKAREQGVRFFRFDPESGKPEVVSNEKGLKVRVFDRSLGESITLTADLVVLSTGIEPLDSNREMASIFKVGLDQDGFFMEAHPKLRPVDTATTGIYIAGTAQGPKFIEECIDQAKASAAKVVAFLNRRYLVTGGRIAVVDPRKCSRCLTCVRVCPYGAPSIKAEGTSSAQIDPAICQGCGICSAECPAKAIDLRCFTDLQIKAKISVMAAA